MANLNPEIEVVKNLDFKIRELNAKNILIVADYPNEGHLEVAFQVKEILERYYRRHVRVIDLAVNRRNFKASEISLYVHEVKKNPTANRLYEGQIDGAIIVRSKRSLGLKKNRYISDLVKDANLPILGLILNQV